MPKFVDIGRRTQWGNPILAWCMCSRCTKYHTEPGSTRECYREYLLERLKTDEKFAREFDELMSKKPVLKCPGCGIGSRTCHGRIMEEVWNSRIASTSRSL